MNQLNLVLSGMMLVLLSACPSPTIDSVIYLNQISAAPVSLVAEVRHPYEAPPTIHLSKSSVMGVSCTEGCYDNDDARSQCQGVVIEVSPPSLASVRTAYKPGTREPHVLIGNEVGTGTVTVSTACATSTYLLTIEP